VDAEVVMKTRILRRRVIIREYDFKKVRDYALGTGIYQDQFTLYDRVTFLPLSEDQLEKIKLENILRGKIQPWNEIPSIDPPRNLLRHLKDMLYDEKYINWDTTIEDGFIYVQARKNTPKTMIGLGIFEKDLTSRI